MKITSLGTRGKANSDLIRKNCTKNAWKILLHKNWKKWPAVFSTDLFDLIYFRGVGQKYRNIFVRFLVQMKTSKSHSEIIWPLGNVHVKPISTHSVCGGGGQLSPKFCRPWHVIYRRKKKIYIITWLVGVQFTNCNLNLFLTYTRICITWFYKVSDLQYKPDIVTQE